MQLKMLSSFILVVPAFFLIACNSQDVAKSPIEPATEQPRPPELVVSDARPVAALVPKAPPATIDSSSFEDVITGLGSLSSVSLSQVELAFVGHKASLDNDAFRVDYAGGITLPFGEGRLTKFDLSEWFTQPIATIRLGKSFKKVTSLSGVECGFSNGDEMSVVYCRLPSGWVFVTQFSPRGWPDHGAAELKEIKKRTRKLKVDWIQWWPQSKSLVDILGIDD